MSYSKQIVESVIKDMQNGKMIIMVDDKDRENEGDLVMASQFITPDSINFMATHARGLICLTMTKDQTEKLGLSLMPQRNMEDGYQTPFTISIEAKEGVTTGISAADRARTVQVAINPSAMPEDLSTPGHIFPLRAQDGGVLVRAGHTEGSVDLAKISGLNPSAVICEIMKEDGTMARLADLKEFSKEHDLPIISIQDIISYRMETETLVEEVASSKLPTEFGEFTMTAFKSMLDGTEHLAITKNRELFETSEVMVRVHSECLTGDAFGSLRCDCGNQLKAAMNLINESNIGAVVYMRNHEGRGIGLANKVCAYALQDQGYDTIEANEKLGFKADLRQYGIGAQIIKKLGINKMKIITNNPKKIVGLSGYGIELLDNISIEIEPNKFNYQYLNTKKESMGHKLNMEYKGN